MDGHAPRRVISWWRMKQYRAWTPEQSHLLPPSPLEWLPAGHLAYFLLELVRELDLTAIEEAIQSKDHRGTRPYSPRMMTTLILYAYSVGVYSSRKIERATHEDVAFRVLSGGEHPHFSTVSDFRLQHRALLAGFFREVLGLCRRAGLVSLGHVSLDGTKVQANASKHKAMSYARMKEEEKRLAAEVEAMLFRADEVDREEDERYGEGQRPEDLPAELQTREARLKMIRQAKAELEREAKEARAAELLAGAAQNNEQAQSAPEPTTRKRFETRARKLEEHVQKLFDDDDGAPPTAGAKSELPQHRVARMPDGKPTPKAQRNFTDSDSRIMVKNGVFLQAYNAQIVVDEDAQVIVAEAVGNQAPDVEYLEPLLMRTIANCAEVPDVVTADTGYFSKANVDACERLRVDPYIAVKRKLEKDGALGRLPNNDKDAARQVMHAKLLRKIGRRIYSRRKTITEPVFGQIKQERGFRRFSLRGLSKVRNEWSIVCTCHNIMKLFRAIGSLKRLPIAAAG